MTSIEDSIYRDTDAILDALQVRLTARPHDPELRALFKDAVRSVALVFPANSENATPEERAEYMVGINARIKALPQVFRNAENPRRALRNLVICLHCVDRLERAQWLDEEAANDLRGQILGHYAVFAPLEDAP